MPPASRLLRLLGFAMPAALLLAGVQPIMGAATGSIGPLWAAQLAAPAIAAAAVLVQPPWYTAWLLTPGAFLLAGAASMCIFGALVYFPLIAPTMWALVGAGSVAWAGGIVVVGRASR